MKKKQQTLKLYASKWTPQYVYVGEEDGELIYISTLNEGWEDLPPRTDDEMWDQVSTFHLKYDEGKIANDLAVIAAGKSDLRNWLSDSDRGKHAPFNTARFENPLDWGLIAVAEGGVVKAAPEGANHPHQSLIVEMATKIIKDL